MLQDISDQEFDTLITRAIDELPQEYIKRLDNVAVVMADEPSAEQRQKMKLDSNQLLLGLYEGVPKPGRGAGYNLVLPDKITLFKNQLLAISTNQTELFENIKRTIWHEIAHHYGLNHEQISKLQKSK